MRAFTVIDVRQRTEEWRRARAGRLTGSRAVDMLSTVKGKPNTEAAGRRNVRTQYVLERITGVPQESNFVSADMRWGTEHEQEALALYEAVTGCLVRRLGFLQHTDLMAGVSPDAVIGDFDGLVECKAPKSATHMGYLLSGKVPYDYLCQIRHGLWLTGATYCEFISYDPRFPESLRLFMSRVEASTLDLPAYDREVRTFLKEVEDEQAAVHRLMEKQRVA